MCSKCLDFFADFVINAKLEDNGMNSSGFTRKNENLWHWTDQSASWWKKKMMLISITLSWPTLTWPWPASWTACAWTSPTLTWPSACRSTKNCAVTIQWFAAYQLSRSTVQRGLQPHSRKNMDRSSPTVISNPWALTKSPLPNTLSTHVSVWSENQNENTRHLTLINSLLFRPVSRQLTLQHYDW